MEPADPDDDRPPFPDDGDAPPQEPVVMEDPTPMGFWPELVAAVRRELKPPVVGFFVVTANAPVQGRLVSGGLELLCNNRFVADSLGRAEVLEVVTRKASAQLGRPVRVSVVDLSARPASDHRMEQLLDFGKNHPNVVRIKKS